MPQTIAFVTSVKSGLDDINLASCSGVQSLTSTSLLSFIESAVEVVVVVVVVTLLLEEEGLIL